MLQLYSLKMVSLCFSVHSAQPARSDTEDSINYYLKFWDYWEKTQRKAQMDSQNKITAFKPLLAYPKKLLSAVSNRCGNVTTQGSLLGL